MLRNNKYIFQVSHFFSNKTLRKTLLQCKEKLTLDLELSPIVHRFRCIPMLWRGWSVSVDGCRWANVHTFQTPTVHCAEVCMLHADWLIQFPVLSMLFVTECPQSRIVHLQKFKCNTYATIHPWMTDAYVPRCAVMEKSTSGFRTNSLCGMPVIQYFQ